PGHPGRPRLGPLLRPGAGLATDPAAEQHRPAGGLAGDRPRAGAAPRRGHRLPAVSLRGRVRPARRPRPVDIPKRVLIADGDKTAIAGYLYAEEAGLKDFVLPVYYVAPAPRAGS